MNMNNEPVTNAIGTKWDDYSPLAIAGEGAYGTVYTARCKQSNQTVAIKRVDQSLLVRVGKVGAAHREK
jgi:serine/threonine protein kinase